MFEVFEWSNKNKWMDDLLRMKMNLTNENNQQRINIITTKAIHSTKKTRWLLTSALKYIKNKRHRKGFVLFCSMAMCAQCTVFIFLLCVVVFIFFTPSLVCGANLFRLSAISKLWLLHCIDSSLLSISPHQIESEELTRKQESEKINYNKCLSSIRIVCAIGMGAGKS